METGGLSAIELGVIELTIIELSTVDWTAPWLAPYRRYETLARSPDWQASLTRIAAEAGIRTACDRPLRFVEPSMISAPYEAHIAATGEVATRANRHDFFNALVWLEFPRTKARLNALQAEAIAREGIGARRGAVRDAATLIDENGLLLVTRRSDLGEALRRQDWAAFFVDARALWSIDVRAVIFGHALLDKLCRPYKSLTAHAWIIEAAADTPHSDIDALWAGALGGELTPRTLTPVPVLGIPGWWPDNERASFYDDSSVFRPARGRPERILTKRLNRQ